jgi:hypothetical protein
MPFFSRNFNENIVVTFDQITDEMLIQINKLFRLLYFIDIPNLKTTINFLTMIKWKEKLFVLGKLETLNNENTIFQLHKRRKQFLSAPHRTIYS